MICWGASCPARACLVKRRRCCRMRTKDWMAVAARFLHGGRQQGRHIKTVNQLDALQSCVQLTNEMHS